MIGLEQLQDIFTAVFVIIILSVVLTLAWVSTYVRDQPLVTATVVVLQQELTTMTEPTENYATSQINMPHTDPPGVKNLDRPTGRNPGRDEIVNSSDEQEQSPFSGNENDCIIGCTSSIPLPTEHNSSSGKQSYSTKEAVHNMCTLADPTHGLNCDDFGSLNDEASMLRNRKKYNEKIISKPKSEDKVHVPTPGEQAEKEKDKNIISGNNNDVETAPPGCIRIRLKFLDDTQRLVRGQLSELVGNFKRANFEIELSTNCAVRLIFNGKLLNRDSSTLEQYGLFDNCVVHCYVGQPQPHPTADTALSNANSESDDIDLSEILSPLLLIVVLLLWYLRYEYSHIFNTSATIILVCLTALLLISQYALTITFNISMAFNNSVIGNQHSGNRDDSPPSVSHSSVDTMPEPEELLDIAVAGTGGESNPDTSHQPSETDINSRNTFQRIAPGLSTLNDKPVKPQKFKITDCCQGNFVPNSNLVSVS